ncbi:hypothetical protein LINPERPRIM_LOCUS20781, partial [Linum perenne]
DVDGVHPGAETTRLHSRTDDSDESVVVPPPSHFADDGRASRRAQALQHRHSCFSLQRHRYQRPRKLLNLCLTFSPFYVNCIHLISVDTVFFVFLRWIVMLRLASLSILA